MLAYPVHPASTVSMHVQACYGVQGLVKSAAAMHVSPSHREQLNLRFPRTSTEIRGRNVQISCVHANRSEGYILVGVPSSKKRDLRCTASVLLYVSSITRTLSLTEQPGELNDLLG